VASFARFADAAAIFLKDHCQQIENAKAILAVAGPIEGERSVLTNCSWVIDTRPSDCKRALSMTSRQWPVLCGLLPLRMW
jgi:glucokinase